MKAAFYKGTRPGIAGIYNRLVRWWTKSPYSHVELIFCDGQRFAGELAASASNMDGGVRTKVIAFDPARWDFIELPDSLADRAWQWFREHDGAAYDLVGNLQFVLAPIPHSQQRWFCSEAVAAALDIPDPWRYSPGTLASALTLLCPAPIHVIDERAAA